MNHDAWLDPTASPVPVIRPLADRLNRHLLRWAAACAVLAIGMQGYTAWRHTASEFNQAVQEVAATHVPLLAASVWDIEPDLLRRQMANLLTVPEIAHVHLMTSTGHLYEAGDGAADGDKRRFSLAQPGRPEVTIGELRITANRSALYRELAYNVLPSLIALGLLTVAILWRTRLTLQRDLQEPLRRLTEQVQALSPQTLGQTVRLPRGPGHLRDEIDLLADGFQALQESLARYVQRGERNLEGQVALLTELLDALPNPVFVKSTDLVYTHCNRAYEEAFGIARAELVGRTVLELPYFSMEMRQGFQHEDAELIARGGRTQDEVDYRYADGSLRNTLRLRATYRLPDGTVGGLIGTIVDISERRRRERHAIFRRDMFELIANDAGLASLFAAILQGVGRMLEARVALLIGDTEMAGEAGVDPVHVVGWPQLAQALRAAPHAWAAALPRQREALPHLADHALGEVLGLGPEGGASLEGTWAEPVSTARGQFIGVMLVTRPNRRGPDEVDQDLLTSTCRLVGVALERARAATHLERLRAEEAESRRQFKLTIDSMQEGYIRACMDDLTQRVNVSLVRMLGYDSQLEMMGTPSKQFYARIEDWRQLVSEVMGKGYARGLRCQARRRDGSTLWVEASAHQALDASGRIIGIEGMVRDISGRIEAEEALQRARDEAQAAADAKGAFLANMSHEIRTPLNAVIGMTELALRTELTRQQRGYLDKVRGAASGLLEILNDVLDAAKIESGRLDIEAVAFDLSDVLDGAAMLVALPVEQKGLKLRVERAPGVPHRLVGDPLRVRQVLLNLLSNACKFTEKGEIVLAVAARAPGGAPDATTTAITTLRFAVRDSGIGMTTAQQEQLFQPFVQADGSTTRRFGGSGLGLSISRQLVEMMGGRIEVQSQPGQGSTFTVELPFGRADDTGLDAGSAAASAPEGPVPRRLSQAEALDPTAWRALRGSRVLLVEDNAINRQVATELLTQAGVLVDVALHGGEALERLRSAGPQAYDAVLMDLQMPVMDGYTATRNLRRDPDFRSLPILALTASVMAQDRQRVLQAGMNGHIAKPILPVDLFSTLLRWIGPREGGDPGAPATGSPQAAPPVEEAPTAPLPPLEGLDLARALEQVGGRRGLLVRLLRDFLHDHADDAHRVALALADDDRPAARRIAHTLKSVAGTLAADRLRQEAMALESRLGDDAPALAPDDAAVEALRDALEPVVRGLREWTANAVNAANAAAMAEPAPGAGSAPHSPVATALRPRLDAIQRLLSEMDPEAVDQVESLLEAWPGAPGLAWRLAEEASRFDFEAAALTLGELQSTLS